MKNKRLKKAKGLSFIPKLNQTRNLDLQIPKPALLSSLKNIGVCEAKP